MKDHLRGVGKVVAFALFVLALAAVLLLILNQLAAGQDERQQQAAQITALQAGLDEANERLADEGEPPVDVPGVEPGDDPQDPVIIQGERGFTGATGAQGRTGPPGEIGPRGPLGPRGEPGKDSTVPGPAGVDGTNGINGADGRGIQSMQCATGGWIVTYTDLSTASDVGPCTGPQGVHGEQGAQGIQGEQGTAKPGDYACEDSKVMTGFTVAEDGTVTLACRDAVPPIIDTP